MSDPDAELQDALAAIFAEASSVDDALARLRDDPRCAPFRDYVEAMEPRMIELALALAARWSVRDDGLPR